METNNLVNAFDTITSFSDFNASDGYKTNSAYTVNQRFIIPNIAYYHRIGGARVRLNIDNIRIIKQIETVNKSLHDFIGLNPNTIDLSKEVNNNKILWGKWHEWGLFNIRFYKKGTAHFEFKNKSVWILFNKKVAELKGWNTNNLNI